MTLSTIVCIAGLILFVAASLRKNDDAKLIGKWGFIIGLVFTLWYAGTSPALPALLKQ